MVYIGSAGWSISQTNKFLFPEQGTHLERYSQVFDGVEINSSFYRDHKASTYSRWAESVPDKFKFSVKLSQYFSHENKLRVAGVRLKETLAAIFIFRKN